MKFSALVGMICLCAILIATVAITGGAGAANRHGRVRAAPAMPQPSPATVRTLRRRAVARQAWLRSPKATRARTRSRTAYRRVAGSEALGIARDHFGDVIDEPVYSGLRLHAGERVADYLNDNVALINLPGTDRQSVARSTLPLLTKGRDGKKVPTDLRLERHGGRLEPKAPVTPVAFDEDTASGITFTDAGVTVHPQAAGDSVASLVEDKLFFANVNTDTDLLEFAVPGGAETFSVLRSSASPEDLGFRFDLPRGAELRLVPGVNGFPSGAQVVRDGNLLLDVLPAQARDANGVGVPVSYGLEGDRLVLHVPHRSAAVRYPLLVDPTIRNGTETGGGWAGWRSGATSTGYTFDFTPVNFPSYGWKYGMRIRANGNPMNAGQYGNWYWQGPANTWIYAADWRYVTFEWLFQVVNAGVVTSSGTWETAGTQPNPQQLTRSYENHYMRFCYRSPIVCGAIPDGARYHDLDGNSMIFGMQTQVTGNFSSGVYASMQGADIYSHETYPPSVTAFTTNTGTGWHDTDLATTSATYSAHDDGFGVWQYSVQSVAGIDAHLLGCSGQLNSACPVDTSGSTVAYSLAGFPEGVSNLEFWVTDPINNASPHRDWPIKIDRSPPSAPALSGSLWTHRNQTIDHREEGLYDASYTLNAQASDARSGMKSIDVQVDSGPPYHYVPPCSGSDGCPASIPPWTFNTDAYTDGDHTITVTAKDQLADKPGIENARHVSTTSFQVTVDRRGDIYHALGWSGDPAQPASDQLNEEWGQIGTQNARIVAPDGITTRNVAACVSDVQGCAVVRSRSQDPAAPSAPQSYHTDTGTSHDDQRFREISQLLTPANSNLGQPSSTGAIQTALQPWQSGPPAHGTTYSLYVTVDQPVVDGATTDQTRKLWIDTTTRMPLRELFLDGSTVTSDVLYTYDRERRTAAELPADQFSVGMPSNLGEVTADQQPVPVVLPPPPDTSATRQDLIDDSIGFRQDFGLNADPAYVESLVDDPLLDNSSDEFGVPMTSAELTDMNHRLDAESEITVIDDYGEGAAAADYAGAYVDSEHGGLIYVGFTANVAAHMQDLQVLYPYPELLRAFPTSPTRTYVTLTGLAARIESDWDAGTLDADNISGLSVNEETNKVEVWSPLPTPVAAADLQARYGSGVTLIERSLEGTGFSAESYPIPPYIGGLEIHRYIPEKVIDCESGLGAVRRYGRNVRWYDISAGHCIGAGKTGYGIKWFHSPMDTFYGATRGNTYANGGNTDGLSIEVKSGASLRRILLRSGHERRITGQINRFHVHPKQILCVASRTYGRPACGRVIGGDGPANVNGKTVRHIVTFRTKHCRVRKGDSGAPIYKGHRAAGVLAGGGISPGKNCGVDARGRQKFDIVGFSPIKRLLSGLSLELP